MARFKKHGSKYGKSFKSKSATAKPADLAVPVAPQVFEPVSPSYIWHFQFREGYGDGTGPECTAWTEGLCKKLKHAVLLSNLFHSSCEPHAVAKKRCSWFTDWRGSIKPSIAKKICLLELQLIKSSNVLFTFYVRQVDLADRLKHVRRFSKAWKSRDKSNRVTFRYYDLQGNLKKLTP